VIIGCRSLVHLNPNGVCRVARLNHAEVQGWWFLLHDSVVSVLGVELKSNPETQRGNSTGHCVSVPSAACNADRQKTELFATIATNPLERVLLVLGARRPSTRKAQVSFELWSELVTRTLLM